MDRRRRRCLAEYCNDTLEDGLAIAPTGYTVGLYGLRLWPVVGGDAE
ncbi:MULTISPECIES: hypothetical protein [Streptomyces]|uniref:Uncharacterized protein n=2 Tax=Streptomyces TaxID=1883 RepID=A0ABV9J4G7_9ACTN